MLPRVRVCGRPGRRRFRRSSAGLCVLRDRRYAVIFRCLDCGLPVAGPVAGVLVLTCWCWS